MLNLLITLASFRSIRLENKCQIKTSEIFPIYEKIVRLRTQAMEFYEKVLPFNEDCDCDLYKNLQVFTRTIPSHVSEIQSIFVFILQGKLSEYSNKPILIGKLKPAFQGLNLLRAITVAAWSKAVVPKLCAAAL
jgi:hypothetical protein